MKFLIQIILITAAACLQMGCGSGEKSIPKSSQTYVVKREAVHKNLFFTGTIQPLQESSLSAPFDAVVQTMNYHYGQLVKKGDVVLTLDSADLQKQYNETLTEYLKAKDSYNISKAKFVGTKDLWDAGLLAKNNYLSEKSSVDTARVTLMQATRKLSEMLEKMDDQSKQDLSSLDIAEFDKVRQAFTGQHNLIHLKASGSGILLYPPKSSEDKSDKLTVGSSVKAGQVIALIGDLRGISVEIDIPEIDIDKIHPGMKAAITGVALGNQTLHGEIVAVNAQASASSGTLPSFTAIIEVKQLTDEQKTRVKVGMSAAIALAVDNEQQLQVPIAAIRQSKGATVVQVQEKDGKLRDRVVSTGSAEADKVTVLAGLDEDETIIYDN